MDDLIYQRALRPYHDASLKALPLLFYILLLYIKAVKE